MSPVVVTLVWLNVPDAWVYPVTPDIAPAEEMSMLVVSKAKVPDPPPIDTKVLEVPVLIEVVKLAELLMVVMPVKLSPPVP